MLDKITFKSDLFSVGVIVYDLCGYHNYRIKLGFKSGIFPVIEDDQNKSILKIAKMLMSVNPLERSDPKIVLSILI